MNEKYENEYRSKIPSYTLAALDAYETRKVGVGGFLTAVLINDLKLSVALADGENRVALADIVDYVRFCMPQAIVGTIEKMKAHTSGTIEYKEEETKDEKLEKEVSRQAFEIGRLSTEIKNLRLTVKEVEDQFEGEMDVATVDRMIDEAFDEKSYCSESDVECLIDDAKSEMEDKTDQKIKEIKEEMVDEMKKVICQKLSEMFSEMKENI